MRRLKQMGTCIDMLTKSVYLAGPISGKTYQEARHGWRQELASMFSDGIEPLSPMRQEGHLEEITEKLHGMAYDSHAFSKQRAIVGKDLFDVKRCDLVVVNLLGSEIVSIGTMIEMGWAHMAGKPIILIIDEDSKDNPHHHLFVYELPDYTVHTLEDAAFIVNGLLSTGV